MKLFKLGLAILFASVMTLGCKTSDETTISTTSTGGTIEMKVVASSTASNNISFAVGQATATNLTSLKYFIRDIKLCQSLTVSGSGYSGQSGCIWLYTATETPDYDSYLADQALADTTNYIDLMTRAGRDKLNKTVTLTAEDVGSYYWGIIDWYRPIKVTGTVTLADGSGSLYTKSGTTITESGTGIGATYVTQVTGTATEPAAEAIVVLPNGGNWFRFQSPLVITDAHIADQTSFALKLVFNPEGIIKGYSSSTRTGVGIKDTGTGAVIHVPMLDLAPVAHQAGDTVKKESYLLTYAGSTITPVTIRVELYYLASDSAKTIYGVEGKYLYTADSTGELGDFYKTSYIETGTGGAIEFQDWAKVSFLTGFTRLTTAGETGTATLNCASSYGFGSCTSGTLAVTTKLVSVSTVE